MGNVPLITPWAATECQAARGAAPGGRPGRQAPVSSGLRNQPRLLGWQVRGPVEAWLPAAGQPLAGPVRVQTREEWPSSTGDGCAEGCPPRGSQPEPGRWDLPPWAGPGLPPTLQRILLTQHLPSLGCPAFQLNPNYKWV